jgi:glycosyltransferase involved in cell wall biosynthesis
VPALLTRSSSFLAGAAAVIAATHDSAARINRHFPPIVPVVQPFGPQPFVTRPVATVSATGRLIVAVLGAIGIEKGFEVLLACANDAARRNLPLEFVLIGHSIDDDRLLSTGRCFVTGPYEPDEAVALITACEARLGFVPSIWPETWCFTLSEIWGAGLPAVAFDIGAPAARIKQTGHGSVLQLGEKPEKINDKLLAVLSNFGH